MSASHAANMGERPCGPSGSKAIRFAENDALAHLSPFRNPVHWRWTRAKDDIDGWALASEHPAVLGFFWQAIAAPGKVTVVRQRQL